MRTETVGQHQCSTYERGVRNGLVIMVRLSSPEAVPSQPVHPTSNMPQTMRALMSDGDKVKVANNVPVPTPAEGQVLVAVSSATVNHSDIARLSNDVVGGPGGSECCGTVIGSGGGMLGLGLVRRRVAARRGSSGTGAWAEFMVCDAGDCVPLDDDVSDDVASCSFEVPGTALALSRMVHAGKHTAVVVTAAAGALARLIMLSLLRPRGSNSAMFPGGSRRHHEPPIIIATVRTQEQAKAIADSFGSQVMTVNSSEKDFVKSLKGLCNEHNPTLAFDLVGGGLTSQLLDALPEKARLVMVGMLGGGETASVPISLMSRKGIQVETFSFERYWSAKKHSERHFSAREVQRMYRDGVYPRVASKCGFDKATETLKKYKKAMSKGKHIITPHGSGFMTPHMSPAPFELEPVSYVVTKANKSQQRGVSPPARQNKSQGNASSGERGRQANRGSGRRAASADRGAPNRQWKPWSTKPSDVPVFVMTSPPSRGQTPIGGRSSRESTVERPTSRAASPAPTNTSIPASRARSASPYRKDGPIPGEKPRAYAKPWLVGAKHLQPDEATLATAYNANWHEYAPRASIMSDTKSVESGPFSLSGYTTAAEDLAKNIVSSHRQAPFKGKVAEERRSVSKRRPSSPVGPKRGESPPVFSPAGRNSVASVSTRKPSAAWQVMGEGNVPTSTSKPLESFTAAQEAPAERDSISTKPAEPPTTPPRAPSERSEPLGGTPSSWRDKIKNFLRIAPKSADRGTDSRAGDTASEIPVTDDEIVAPGEEATEPVKTLDLSDLVSPTLEESPLNPPLHKRGSQESIPQKRGSQESVPDSVAALTRMEVSTLTPSPTSNDAVVANADPVDLVDPIPPPIKRVSMGGSGYNLNPMVAQALVSSGASEATEGAAFSLPGSSNKAMLKVAQDFETKGNDQKALSGYEAAININPRDHTAVAGYSSLLKKVGRGEDATNVVRKALASSNTEFTVALEREVAPAEEIRQAWADATCGYAGLFAALGDTELAKDAFEEASRLGSAAAVAQFAEWMFTQEPNGPAEAVALYKRVVYGDASSALDSNFCVKMFGYASSLKSRGESWVPLARVYHLIAVDGYENFRKPGSRKSAPKDEGSDATFVNEMLAETVETAPPSIGNVKDLESIASTNDERSRRESDVAISAEVSTLVVPRLSVEKLVEAAGADAAIPELSVDVGPPEEMHPAEHIVDDAEEVYVDIDTSTAHAVDLLSTGKTAAAVKVMAVAHEADPDVFESNVKALYMYSRAILFDYGDHELAGGMLRVASELADVQTPIYNDVIFLQAIVVMRRGDLATARSLLQLNLKLDPEHPSSLYLMFEIHHRLGESKGAESFYNRLMATGPESLMSALDEAVVYYERAVDHRKTRVSEDEDSMIEFEEEGLKIAYEASESVRSTLNATQSTNLDISFGHPAQIDVKDSLGTAPGSAVSVTVSPFKSPAPRRQPHGKIATTRSDGTLSKEEEIEELKAKGASPAVARQAVSLNRALTQYVQEAREVIQEAQGLFDSVGAINQHQSAVKEELELRRQEDERKSRALRERFQSVVGKVVTAQKSGDDSLFQEDSLENIDVAGNGIPSFEESMKSLADQLDASTINGSRGHRNCVPPPTETVHSKKTRRRSVKKPSEDELTKRFDSDEVRIVKHSGKQRSANGSGGKKQISAGTERRFDDNSVHSPMFRKEAKRMTSVKGSWHGGSAVSGMLGAVSNRQSPPPQRRMAHKAPSRSPARPSPPWKPHDWVDPSQPRPYERTRATRSPPNERGAHLVGLVTMADRDASPARSAGRKSASPPRASPPRIRQQSPPRRVESPQRQASPYRSPPRNRSAQTSPERNRASPERIPAPSSAERSQQTSPSRVRMLLDNARELEIAANETARIQAQAQQTQQYVPEGATSAVHETSPEKGSSPTRRDPARSLFHRQSSNPSSMSVASVSSSHSDRSPRRAVGVFGQRSNNRRGSPRSPPRSPVRPDATMDRVNSIAQRTKSYLTENSGAVDSLRSSIDQLESAVGAGLGPSIATSEPPSPGSYYADRRELMDNPIFARAAATASPAASSSIYGAPSPSFSTSSYVAPPASATYLAGSAPSSSPKYGAGDLSRLVSSMSARDSAVLNRVKHLSPAQTLSLTSPSASARNTAGVPYSASPYSPSGSRHVPKYY